MTAAKKITIDAVPEHIMEDIRQYLQAKQNSLTDEQILSQFSANELFDFWCNWNGFINYSENIRTALDSIRRAKK